MKRYGKHAKEHIAKEWRTWFNDKKYDLEYQDSILKVLWEQVERLKGAEFTQYADVYEEMLDEYQENERQALAVLESECPIGFFQPSWEQAQVLNAWHPEFEPHIAPNGYRSVCLFCGNQIGKTCISVINTELWFTPNNPDWAMFREYEDTSEKRRGKYQVKMRPDWALWNRTGKMIYRPDEPPMGPCECWHGVENDDAWKNKVAEEYKKWAPKDWLGRRADGGTAIFVQERRIESRFGHKITGKTFNADIQDWAGKPDLRIINIDEGIPPHLLREGLLRIGGSGYFMWPYTPVEARNTGQRAKCAWEVYQGKLKLVGQTKFFLDFSMLDAPDFVMNKEKKADNLARLTGTEGEDKIRREGGFFNSSPVVFTNYERKRNVIPLKGAEILLAIQGKTVTRWVEAFGKNKADDLQWRFDRANILRGMDEGLANPTACVWEAVLRTGEYVAFKEWEESGLSVSERCKEIVERSGNTVECLNPEAVSERRRYRERKEPDGMKVKRTFADSKMFKRNPESPQDDWTETYAKAGLRLERATSIGPAARCDQVNDMLRGEAGRQHIIDSNLPGSRMYIAMDCVKIIERCENYLQEQFLTGQRAGEYTGNPEKRDDHTVDAWCYAGCSKLRWHDSDASQSSGSSVRIDSLTGAIIR